jgi:photosystem II stability/assembly factor-like uncharacterized protein
MKRLILLSSFFLLLITILPAQWQPTNGPYESYVNGLCIKDQYIFALAPGTGVFFSSDNGTTWSPRNNGLTNLRVQCIAAKGNRIFVGTEYGLFFSDDNGSDWNTALINGLANISVTAIASNTQSIFIIAADTLYKSNDGISWSKILYDQGLISIGINGNTIFIGSNNEILYRSLDDGNNFVAIDISNDPDLNSTDSFTFLGGDIFVTGGSGMMYKSVDNGTNWMLVTNVMNYQGDITLAVHGSNLYAGCFEGSLAYNYQSYGGLYVSQNEGTDWTLVGLAGLSVKEILFSGNRIITGTLSDGIFYSDDGGITWNSSSFGLVRLPIQAITKNGSALFVSCEYPNYVFKSADQGVSWSPSDSGMSNPAVSLFAVGDSFMLAGGQGVYISYNDGVTWHLIFNPGFSITSLIISGSLIFTGTSAGIFLSDDLGNNWHSVNNGLANSNVTTMVSKGNILFAGTSTGVYRSSDNGSTWTEVNNGIAGYYINAMASNNDFVFASGTSTIEGGIFRSLDNGDNWIKADIGINFTLFNPVLSFAVSNEKIIAGTYYDSFGVLFSGNNGETWSVLNTGLPDNYDISSLVILDSTVYAGLNDYSYNDLGSGVWKRPLSEFIPFELEGDTVLLQATAGDSKNLAITSSTSWVLDGQLPSWVSVNKTSGTASDIITFTTTQANPNSWPRYSFLNIVSEGITRPFTVIQKAPVNGIADQPMNAVSIFPNPTSGNIIINSPAGYNKLTLTNTTGQSLYEQAVNSPKTQLDLTRYGKGVYYLRLSGENNSCIREIIIL